jgi:hypothetical protein
MRRDAFGHSLPHQAFGEPDFNDEAVWRTVVSRGA